MTDLNQLQLPPAFVALFVPPGRSKPNESREHMLARYELCEDLASVLTEEAGKLQWELGAAEDDVLWQIHRGLNNQDSGISAAESRWVVQRLAELLDWPGPSFTDADRSGRDA